MSEHEGMIEGFIKGDGDATVFLAVMMNIPAESLATIDKAVHVSNILKDGASAISDSIDGSEMIALMSIDAKDIRFKKILKDIIKLSDEQSIKAQPMSELRDEQNGQ
jgi:hypothetical protein